MESKLSETVSEPRASTAGAPRRATRLVQPDGPPIPSWKSVADFIGRYDLALLAALTALYYVVTYLDHPAAPNAQSLGWFTWYDQSEYLKTAKDLANFKLTYSVYPLGYPFLGALFIRILPLHPFFIPNLLCATGITLLFYRIAATLVTKAEAFAVTALGVCACSYVWIRTLTYPWNSIPVTFAAFVCVYLVVFRKPTERTLATCSLAITLAFFCRPWDAIFLLMLFGAGVLELATWRQRFKAIAVLASGLSAVALFVAIDYLVVFGTLFSPYYKQHLNDMGFSLANYPLRVYQIFFDGNLIASGNHPAVLEKMPWLILILPGAALVIRRHGRTAIVWFVSMLSMVGFYLTMNGLTPSNFWSYHGYRYLTVFVPFTVLFAYLSLSRAWRGIGWKATLAGLAAGAFVPAVIGERAVVVAEGPAVAGQVSGAAPGTFTKQPVGKSLNLDVRLPRASDLDGIRLQFDRNLTVPVDSSISPPGRVSVQEDGRPAPLWRQFVAEQEPDGAVTILFNDGVKSPLSRVDATFAEIDNDSLSKVVVLKAQFQPFGYFSHVMSVLKRRRFDSEVAAHLVATPWDLTGSVAGVPDGQLDFAIDCDLGGVPRNRLADMEIQVRSGNVTGKWATHSRGMNWDKLAFAAGYVEDDLKAQHPPQVILTLDAILNIPGRFTILFKLPEQYWQVPLTLVGLDRQGHEVFIREIAPIEHK